ncbi:T9SS type A sorting domain-containing protein [Crocinitomix catalasitica]|nr:T9SS type A sorting domain-containing protein [Crocinitomix catalasitica]
MTPITDVSASPNPSNNLVNIQIYGAARISGQWKLTTAEGRIVSSNKLSKTNFNLDLSVYKNGIYFFTIHCGTEIKTIKILKQ